MKPILDFNYTFPLELTLLTKRKKKKSRVVNNKNLITIQIRFDLTRFSDQFPLSLRTERCRLPCLLDFNETILFMQYLFGIWNLILYLLWVPKTTRIL